MTKFAMIFPGQGSQTVSMLTTLAAHYSVVQKTFLEASDVLNYDLWQLTSQGPSEELNKTWQTQPAILTASVAIWRVWQQQGGKNPAFMIGHSLGEYSALVCASALNFQEAVCLVAQRGKWMQEALPEGTGAMYAIIGCDLDAVIASCETSSQGQVVSPINFNSPEQVVIAGNKEAVERAVKACKASGAKRVLSLPINVPSHCILMKPAAEKLASVLKGITINPPAIPVVNNVDVCVETDPDKIRTALEKQLYSPVRWIECISFVASKGIHTFLEIGPGKVLTGFTKRIVDTLSVLAVNDPASLSAALERIS